MARVDKTDSAVGVVRAALAADLSSVDFDTVIGVGITSAGKVNKGAQQSGIIGLMVPSKYHAKAGDIVDIFKLGDIVEITGLAAGTKYYVTAAGVLTATASTNTYCGYTVEADRLVIAGF